MYNKLYEHSAVSFPLHDENIDKIDSVVKTVNSDYFGSGLRYPSKEEQAAAYFYYIIKDHAFPDGNKRVAVLWLETFCEVYGLDISTRLPLDVLAVAVAISQNSKDELIEFIRVILFNNNATRR